MYYVHYYCPRTVYKKGGDIRVLDISTKADAHPTPDWSVDVLGPFPTYHEAQSEIYNRLYLADIRQFFEKPADEGVADDSIVARFIARP